VEGASLIAHILARPECRQRSLQKERRGRVTHHLDVTSVLGRTHIEGILPLREYNAPYVLSGISGLVAGMTGVLSNITSNYDALT